MRVVGLCAAVAMLLLAQFSAASFEGEFIEFKAKHGKQYATAEEEKKRFEIFTANMRKAREIQSVNPKARFGANEFADLSEAEFKTRHNAEKFYAKARQVKRDTITFTEEQVKAAAGQAQDWRPKGAVTAVKNQGQCGSCWSFSTTGGIEGQWFLAGNKLTSVSEQELVSCDTIDSGCNGGLMDNAFNWLLQNKGGEIVTEASYPYVSGDGTVPACDMSGRTNGAKIDSFKNVANSETDMAAFVYASGPLSIAVDAESWQMYSGGIMTNCPSGSLDHGVLIVGFDDNSTPPYWVIKNSWGPTWGEEGYIRVEKGQGQCSIGQYQTSSIVKPSGPTAPPAPTTSGPNPGPTAPPTPTTNAPNPTSPPSPPSGNQFVQKTCRDPTCKECTEMSFAENTCVKRGDKSFKATCATDAVIVAAYTNADCSGSAVVTANPRDTCSVVFENSGSEHFVQNECRSGPAPGPNPPAPTSSAPQPTTAAPTPAGTFEQKQCTDSACTQCQSHSFPQNTCLKLSSGGSAMAQCTPTELLLTVYELSDSCQGSSTQVPQQINTCQQDSNGGYMENICSSSTLNAIELSGLRRGKF